MTRKIDRQALKEEEIIAAHFNIHKSDLSIVLNMSKEEYIKSVEETAIKIITQWELEEENNNDK